MVLNGSWQLIKEWGLTVLIGLESFRVYKFTPFLLNNEQINNS